MSKNAPAVLITNDTVTLVLKGQSFTGSRAYAQDSGALLALKQGQYERAAELLNKAKAIVRRSLGAFTIENGVIFHNGNPVHNVVAERIVQFVDEGLPFMPLVNFLENLIQNPSNRATLELYDFLENKNLPITEDGHFLAYKSVGSDYRDKYSGKIDNSVGQIVEVPRNTVDDNREHECSSGLHVGALDYSGPNGWYHSFGDKVVIVKVNPRDAVSVPRDHNAQKLRVCRYEVIGDFVSEYNAPLTSVTGAEFEGESDPEVFCDKWSGGCGWQGAYTRLKKGYGCPICDSGDFLESFDEEEFD